MATILTEDFETGTLNAAITTGNSNADTIYGAPTFSDGAVEGALCGRFNSAAAITSIVLEHTPTTGTGWVSFYLHAAALPPANAYIAMWVSAALTTVVDMRLQPDGKLVVRNGSVATVTSAVSITATTWHRVAIRVTQNSQVELRMYLGANLHGSVPDWSGTGTSSIDSTLARFSCGVTVSTTLDIKIDRIRIDNATEPESMIPAGIPLDAPAITATTTNPSTIGGTDGAVTVNMPVPVAGAATYEVRRLNAASVVQETVQRTFAQFPHTFTGRPAETGSVDVQAKP